MIAADTGYLYALVDRRDRWHAQALTVAGQTSDETLVTTWPVLAESCHLMARRLGSRFAAALMDDVASGAIGVWHPSNELISRIPALMRKYADLPMDLSDATLVLLAEHLGHGRIVTTDLRDFGRYRWKSRQPFHNLMETGP